LSKFEEWFLKFLKDLPEWKDLTELSLREELFISFARNVYDQGYEDGKEYAYENPGDPEPPAWMEDMWSR